MSLHKTIDTIEIIKKYEIPLVITTSASSDALLRDADLLLSMPQKVVTVVELARIPYVEEMNKGGNHAGIDCANQLKQKGLTIWTTLAPILPGITNLDRFLEKLDAAIPIYTDALRCDKGGIQERKTLEWIAKDYPDLLGLYKEILLKPDTSYFEEILKEKAGEKRVRTFPFQLEEIDG